MVLPEVVVLELVWVGVWAQFRVTEDEMGPELSRPSAPDTPSTGTCTTPRPPLIGTSLLHAWSGIWLPLAFTMLSLLKPDVGPPNVAALATGADTPTSAAVATASAKARFLRDMFVFP